MNIQFKIIAGALLLGCQLFCFSAKAQSNDTISRVDTIICTVRIDHIYFDSGSSVVQKRSKENLNVLARVMSDNPQIVVELIGHSDAQGGADHNMRLSILRANSVKDFLILKGISPERISTIGLGESKPTAGNNNEAEGQLNRRVEVNLLVE